jgi:hypothetical protein
MCPSDVQSPTIYKFPVFCHNLSITCLHVTDLFTCRKHTYDISQPSHITSKHQLHNPHPCPFISISRTIMYMTSPCTTSSTLFPNSLFDLIPHLARRRLGLTQSLLRLELQTRLPATKVVVVEVPVSLHELRGEVDGVAAEEQVVGGRDGHSVAHEGTRVEG